MTGQGIIMMKIHDFRSERSVGRYGDSVLPPEKSLVVYGPNVLF
jgi:hypothetical protein